MWILLYLFAALVVSSFCFWKFLRSDFDQEEIFSHFLTIVFVSGVFGYFAGEWGIFFGFLLTLGCWCYYQKWDFGEWLDYWILIALPWIIPFHYFALFIWVVALILSKTYRNFSWYESGKMGFTGLSSVALWGVFKTVVAFVVIQKVYWLGLSIDQWFGVWLAIGGGISLYLRSGRKIWQKRA